MNTKSYFFQSFLIILLSAVFFLVIKQVLPKKIFSEKAGTTKNVLIDSMLIDAFEKEKVNSKTSKTDSLENETITFYEKNGVTFPKESYENYKGFQYLIPFYEKLFQLETAQNGNVRIAYFGDSMTDGDMIVQDFRSSFQSKFGGKGVGFVAITSESATSRSSITHQFSGNWKTQSYLNVKNPIRPFGINGHVFFANDTTNSAWVKYKANNGKFTSQLENPTLFYGNSENAHAKIYYQISNDTLNKKLAPNQLLNTLRLSEKAIKSLRIDFKNARNVPVYGFNFDDGKGVHVDNFSQRGNSGIPISKFNIALMQSFQKRLNYDLIILHYGTNVLNYGTKNYNWYERSMTKTINRLKECFPGVAILIISTADKASKYETTMQTDSAVVPLTLAQKRYALKTQSGFVNLFTLMGGDGAITKWVEDEPTLANKDYTHFNFRGAKKVSELIYSQIYKGYEQYKVLRKKRKAVMQLKPAVTADSIVTNPENETDDEE